MKELDEKILDEELEALADDIPEYGDLAKKIEQSIKKKIQKTVVRTLAWILGIVIALLLIINPLLNLAVSKAYMLDAEGDRQIVTILRSYYETTEPYKEPLILNVKKKGFGRFELEMQMNDRRGPIYYGNMNVWVDLVWGKYKNWKNPDFDLSHLMGRFEQDWNKRDEVVEKMKELPESAIIYLSIGEKNPRKVEELRNENVELNWVELYQPNVEFQGGLYMASMLVHGGEKSRTDITEKELKAEYISNLEDMIAYPLIWTELGLNSSKYSYTGNEVEILKECLEDAKKMETLETKNYCISGKRDVIVEFLEKTDTVSIGVDEVRMSGWN